MSYPTTGLLSKASIVFDYAERKFVTEIDHEGPIESGDYWVQVTDAGGRKVYLQLRISAPRTVLEIVERRGTRREIGVKVFLAKEITSTKSPT